MEEDQLIIDNEFDHIIFTEKGIEIYNPEYEEENLVEYEEDDWETMYTYELCDLYYEFKESLVYFRLLTLHDFICHIKEAFSKEPDNLYFEEADYEIQCLWKYLKLYHSHWLDLNSFSFFYEFCNKYKE